MNNTTNNNMNLTDIPVDLLDGYVWNRGELDKWTKLTEQGEPIGTFDGQFIYNVLAPSLMTGLGREDEVARWSQDAPFDGFGESDSVMFIYTPDFEWVLAVHNSGAKFGQWSALLCRMQKMPWGEIVPIVAPQISLKGFGALDGDNCLNERVSVAAECAMRLVAFAEDGAE